MLRRADEYTGRQHEAATEDDLKGSAAEGSLHEAVLNPYDGPEFDEDDDESDNRRDVRTRDE